MRLRRLSSFIVLAALGLACHRTSATPDSTPSTDAAPPTTNPWEALLAPSAATLRAHVEFLADDAQEGRSPGTDADRRVQAHIQGAMETYGLAPAFGDSFLQPLEVIDGVRLRDGAQSLFSLAKGTDPVAHKLVPFGHDSGDTPVQAKLVYVGQGIAGDKGDGDYSGLGKRLSGQIAVVLATNPSDPHIPQSHKRPQSRVIAARDRGAVAVLLVDPELEVSYPNHGAFSDLRIPVLSVGKSGAPQVFRALGSRTGKPPKLGAKSRRAAEIATPIEPIRLNTANVGGILRGNGSSGKRLVLGAHMDHLGHGTSSSLAPGVDAIHNGADDNASGVATMLAIAEALAVIPTEARPYDVVFYAFAAEEMGLLGSKYLVEHLSTEERSLIAAMINFDMVGRLHDDSLIVSGTGTSTPWPDLLERSRGALTIEAGEGGYGSSDQASFTEAGLPVLHFFTGPHDDYHRPSDDIERVNIQGAVQVGDFALRLVRRVMEERPTFDVIRVAQKTPTRRGFRVSLGTIPDYGAQVEGVKLSGVRPGGPAENAGLRAGDVITGLGGREVHNLDDYMAAFGALEPGVEIVVIIQRKNELIELPMTPSAPSRR